MLQTVSTYRNIRRYREIANVLARHGFGVLLTQSGLINLVSLPLRLFRRGVDSDGRLTPAEHVRIAIEELGPTAIKLGQVLSTRPDLLPPDFIAELERLQDTVPPFPYEEARDVIERELGQPIERIFRSFDPQAVAAASLAQVHYATLPTGEQVAVKVQRPGIERRIEQDVGILRHLASVLERRAEWAQLSRLTEVVDEFAATLYEELDFQLEGRNADQFRQILADNPDVCIPRVYWKYSTRRVLTLERVHGYKINDIEGMRAAGFRLSTVAEAYALAVLEQILIHGYFHADPHPGNVLVSPNRQIVFLDFGMVGYLDTELKQQLVDLVTAVVRQDVDRAARALLDIAVTRQAIDVKALRRDISRMIRRYYNVPIRQIPVHEAIQEALYLAFKYRMVMPSNLTLLSRAMSTMNGVATTLDPDLSIVDIAEPVGRRLLQERTTPERVLREVADRAQTLASAAYSIPLRLNQVLEQAERGELVLRGRAPQANESPTDWNAIVNRLALAVVVAAGAVGSALLILSGRGPAIEGIPIVGLIGMALSGLLGVVLVLMVLRSG